MIITCAECATQFQLEDERVPSSGIRVRCSVCKHAFFVPHPDSLEEDSVDPVDRVVAGVLASEPLGVPESTADLGTPDPPVGRDGGGEESWEFGEGDRLSDASDDPHGRFEESFEAAREAVDALLGGPMQPPEPAPAHPRLADDGVPPDDAAVGAGSEPPAWDALEREPAPLDDPWEKPAWSDEIPDLASAAPDQLAEPVGLAGGEEGPSSPDLEIDDHDASRWWDRELPEAADLQSSEHALPGDDELVFADEGDGDEQSALGEALDVFEVEEPQEVDRDPLDVELSTPDATHDDAIAEDWGLDASDASERGEEGGVAAPAHAELGAAAPLPLGFAMPQDPEREQGSVVAWFARAGNGLGWSAVAILASATLWASVAPRSNPALGQGALAVAGLEVTGVAGRWVENATLGALYVVSGELENPGSETRAPGARIVVRLLDAEGLPVEEAAASVALPLGALALQAAGPDELRAAREAAALELARTPVAPGARLRFEAVLVDLPDAAQRFDLAAAP